jgi:2-oxoisovalerate dehydrogenase E1 component beta subunit
VPQITYLESVQRALSDAMRADERVFMLGEDIGQFGGAFGVTKGMSEEFGEDRVIDTPLAEKGFVGAAIGAAWMGERPIVELQFADFVSCAFDQIVTLAAKTHWRQGIRLPLVIRLPSGGGIRGGPFHASSPEGWFYGTAGLKVVAPGTVADAYGLLRTAVEDDDPVLYFEHKALYRRLRDEAPAADHRVPIGSARIARSGSDATIVTYGSGVDLALRVAQTMAGEASLEVVDLRTLWPLDRATILESLARTSRVLVLQEAARSIGVANAVCSLVAREAFDALDAPPAIHAPIDTPVPFAAELEDAYLPSPTSLEQEMRELLAY